MEGTTPPIPPELPEPPYRHGGYPVTFSVDYPERELNRLTTGLRIFTVIPILIVAGLLPGAAFSSGNEGVFVGFVGAGGSLVVLPIVAMMLFRKKYPRWWFDWNLELMRFLSRIAVYFALMDDRYPSTDDHQAVRLDFGYPDAERLERGMPLVKWLLAVPHYFVLFFLLIGAVFAVIGAWFAILFSGRYPRGIFTYVEGTMRWSTRVTGYAYALVTDEYPPFRLGP